MHKFNIRDLNFKACSICVANLKLLLILSKIGLTCFLLHLLKIASTDGTGSSMLSICKAIN